MGQSVTEISAYLSISAPDENDYRDFGVAVVTELFYTQLRPAVLLPPDVLPLVATIPGSIGASQLSGLPR